MPKPQKIETVKELKERFEQSDAALLAEFRGLKVEEMKELRRSLRASGADFKVVKNTLTRIAVRESDLEGLLPFIEGSTAIAFIKGDPVAAAKGIDEVAKRYPALVLKAGYVEGQILDGQRTQSLALIKPREVMLAELAGMMSSSLSKLAFLLAAPVRSLGYALGAYREKVEKESPPPEAAPSAPAEATAEETAETTAEEAPAVEATAEQAPAAQAGAPEETEEPKES